MDLLVSEFLDRDLSWLTFNDRLIIEASKKNVPLLERLKFLAIFSSNLDEFYKVRVPPIRAISKIAKKKVQITTHSTIDVAEEVTQIIAAQLQKILITIAIKRNLGN